MIKLYQGECLEIMKEIPAGSVDMILCDLPYGTTKNKWDSVINTDLLWSEYERVAKVSAPIVLFAQTPFDKVLGFSNLPLLKYEWIWEKNKATGHLNSKKCPMKAHENILVFYKSSPTYNPQGLVKKDNPTIRRGKSGNGSNYGLSDKDAVQEFENYPRDILRFNMDTNTKHPTQKPVALCEYLIKTYTNEGELVLDNTMGSGTTGVACVNTNRSFVGIEKDAEYFAIAKQRINPN